MAGIDHIRDGELVNAANLGRPDRAMEQRINDLDDAFSGLVAGRALVEYGAPCAPDVLVGMPVFWNPDAMRYEPALAGTTYDPGTRGVVSTPAADVAGVVIAKPGAATADIVFQGAVSIDLGAVVSGSVLPGRYYLSATQAGHLTRQRQSPTVAVLLVLGGGRCLVRPQAREWGLDHEHRAVDLVCRPAGDHVPPAPGGRHTILNPDADIPGWLPASHASFGGHAPAGAQFGYNVSADTALAPIWPPMPVEGAAITWDRGQNRAGGADVPLGLTGLVAIDRYGIWWMSDCNGDVPWPAAYTFSAGESGDYPAPATGECPRQEDMRLRLWFTRTPYDATRLGVTSLRAAANSVLVVRACSGGPATAGDLEVDADLVLAVSDMNVGGHLALKNVNEQQRLVGGPVLEGLIVAPGGNITATSTHPQVLTGGTVLHQGRVTVAAVVDPADRELLPYVVRLLEAKERYASGINYIALPPGQPSGLLVQFRVPSDGIQAGACLVFQLTVLGTLAGALPALTYAWRRIPAGTSTPAALPASDTTLSAGTPPTLSAGNQYVRIALPSVTVQPGDAVLLTIRRAAGDAYAGEVGFVHTVAVVA